MTGADAAAERSRGAAREVDLIVVGGGSGNSIPSPALAGWRIVLVDDGARFGGTCLNVGCIPTKMLIHPAELALEARAAVGTLDAVAGRVELDWAALQRRVFGRIDAISTAGEAYRAGGEPNIELVRERVRLVGDREIETESGERFRARRLVVAAGSRPRELPALPLGERIRTSDTIMRVPALPARLAVVGGGAIACEFATMFAGLGVEVTQLHRSTLLRGFDDDVARAFEARAREQWDVRLGVEVEAVEGAAAEGPMTLALSDGSRLETDLVLVAVGRIPNGERLGAAERGFDLRPDGTIVVDDAQRVLRGGAPVEGVAALGDASSEHALKHVANHDARIVRANLEAAARAEAAGERSSAELARSTLGPVPFVVFAHPQLAVFGHTLAGARQAGLDAIEARCAYGDTAWGWALADETSFLKIVLERGTGRILGAHAIGPDAGILIQPLVQAASFGQGVRGLARGQYWPHPAATEIVENALLRAEELLGPDGERESAGQPRRVGESEPDPDPDPDPESEDPR